MLAWDAASPVLLRGVRCPLAVGCRERVAKARKRMLDRNAQLKEHQDKLAKIKGEKQALIAAAEERERREKLAVRGAEGCGCLRCRLCEAGSERGRATRAVTRCAGDEGGTEK